MVEGRRHAAPRWQFINPDGSGSFIRKGNFRFFSIEGRLEALCVQSVRQGPDCLHIPYSGLPPPALDGETACGTGDQPKGVGHSQNVPELIAGEVPDAHFANAAAAAQVRTVSD